MHLKPLDWIPHIEPVEIAEATPEQLAAMQVTPSAGKVSPYVRTLAHDPDSYLARTELFNAIMYVDGGLRLQDRELGALGASMHNGCAYCATVHAERHSKYAGSTDAVYALMSGQEDKLAPRDAAIVDFARDLSRTPPRATTAQVRALYDHGFDDFEMIDLIHAIAIFGWANRLMHVLGRSEPAAEKN
ncbi:MAG: peroxidase-related enzyme [Alphaproteobacteria bacterium]|nr:peroxidase-related enzyme [Alphaproteobacteria bacterium]